MRQSNMKPHLSKISKVDLRDIWKSEAADFTPWLAQEENIKELGDVVGLDLEVVSQEKNVGPFRADILAKNTSDSHFVLIENQLEVTDHTHLGQIMTYAAGLDACSIIWIAKHFTEEHRAALDWLNHITDEGINFFGIEIEVVKIGDSNPAAQFNIVAKPNGWSKSIKVAANADLSDTRLKQLNYWTDFKKFIQDSGEPFRLQKPLAQHWSIVAMGRSGMYLSLTVNSFKNIICVNLQIDTPSQEDNKAFFDTLKQNYEAEAKTAISQDLQWDRMNDKKVSAVTLSASYNFLDSKTRKEQFEWFKETTIKFRKFFCDKIKTLK